MNKTLQISKNEPNDVNLGMRLIAEGISERTLNVERVILADAIFKILAHIEDMENNHANARSLSHFRGVLSEKVSALNSGSQSSEKSSIRDASKISRDFKARVNAGRAEQEESLSQQNGNLPNFSVSTVK